MEKIDGEWIIHGMDWDEPGCIHTAEELLEVIERVGFLPLFSNDVPGFSVENLTDPTCWWCGDERVDPWEWRVTLSRTGKVAYGKFFGRKAGFVAKKWFPDFANFRRDGYDFDARFDDGRAELREKRIMDQLWPKRLELQDINKKNLEKEVADPVLYSFELTERAGFGKGGEKNFDGVCAKLQMETYLVAKDFLPRVNKDGEAYGWAIARYTLPEYLWGYGFVTGRYGEAPEKSRARIVAHLLKQFDVDEKAILKIIKK